MSKEIAILSAGEIVPGAKIEFFRDETLNGVRYVVTFPNGWGASIIHNSYSYGVELAVLNSSGDLDYSTHITSDVRGWLTPDELVEILNEISRL